MSGENSSSLFEKRCYNVRKHDYLKASDRISVTGDGDITVTVQLLPVIKGDKHAEKDQQDEEADDDE